MRFSFFRWLSDARQLYGPFIPPTVRHMDSVPTKAASLEAMQQLRQIILSDWGELDLLIYPNPRDVWVLRVREDSAESLLGLTAYLNVLARCSSLVLRYGLTRAVEHWGE